MATNSNLPNKRFVPIYEKERIKCELYNAIYQINRENPKFVSPYGNPTIDYWRIARRIVESRIRKWSDSGENPLENLEELNLEKY